MEVHDIQGTLVPTADNEILIAVDGPGRVLGVCSDDPGSHASPLAPRQRAFNGLLLAVVQTVTVAGQVLVRATDDGLDSAEILLETVQKDRAP